MSETAVSAAEIIGISKCEGFLAKQLHVIFTKPIDGITCSDIHDPMRQHHHKALGNLWMALEFSPDRTLWIKPDVALVEAIASH